MNKKTQIIAIIIIGILGCGWFLYDRDHNKKVSTTGTNSNAWVSYAHPYLGYTFEYPKNILPLVQQGDTANNIYFYKNTPEGNPHILVSVLTAHGSSIPEWRGSDFLKTPHIKVKVSGVDAYISTNIDHSEIVGVEFIKGNALYQIGFDGIPTSDIDHVLKSFIINFIPANP